MDTATRVLVVDDEPFVLKSCDRALCAEGMTVVGAATGHEGLSRMQQEGFDVVLLDIKLPDIDGIDILRSIKKDETGIAVVVITGFPSEHNAFEAKKYGAADYVVKPFTPDEIKAAVTKALKTVEPLSKPSLVLETKAIPQRAPDLGLCRSIHTTTRNCEKVAIVGLGGAFDSPTVLWKALTCSLKQLHVPVAVEYGRHEVLGTEIFHYLENYDRVVVVASAQVGKEPGQFVSIRMGSETMSEKDKEFEVSQIGLPQLFSWATAVEIKSDLIVIGVQPDDKGKFFALHGVSGLTHEVMRHALQEECWYNHRCTRRPTQHE